MRWLVVAGAVAVMLSTVAGRVEAFTFGDTAAAAGIQGTLAGNATTSVAGVTGSVRRALPSTAGRAPSLAGGAPGGAAVQRAQFPRGSSGAVGWGGGVDGWARGTWAGAGTGWATGGSWASAGGWATAAGPGR